MRGNDDGCLFLGVSVPRELADAVSSAQEGLRPMCADAAWTTRGRLHLTLRFFGVVPERMRGGLEDDIAAVARATPRFTLRTTGIGPSPGPAPSMLWVGFRDSPEFSRAVRAVDAATGASAPHAPPLMGPTPHVTAARFPDAVPSTCRAVRPVDLEFPVASWTLFRSVPGPDGTDYEPLTVFSLAV